MSYYVYTLITIAVTHHGTQDAWDVYMQVIMLLNIPKIN